METADCIKTNHVYKEPVACSQEEPPFLTQFYQTPGNASPPRPNSPTNSVGECSLDSHSSQRMQSYTESYKNDNNLLWSSCPHITKPPSVNSCIDDTILFAQRQRSNSLPPEYIYLLCSNYKNVAVLNNHDVRDGSLVNIEDISLNKVDNMVEANLEICPASVENSVNTSCNIQEIYEPFEDFNCQSSIQETSGDVDLDIQNGGDDTDSNIQQASGYILSNIQEAPADSEVSSLIQEINDLDLTSNKRRKVRARYKKKLQQASSKCQTSKKKKSKSVSSEPIERPYDPSMYNVDSHDGLMCSICLDVYFQPHLVVPCKHTFCEPCLRRLNKYNNITGLDSVCPICRVAIRECVRDEDLCLQVQYFLPEEYQTRHKHERNSKHMSYPLPSRRTKPSLNLQTMARLMQHRRRQRPRLAREPVNISFWRYLVLILYFLVLKAVLAFVIFGVTALFYGNFSLLQFTSDAIRKYVINYGDLADKDKTSIANITAVVIAGILLLYVIVKKIEEKYQAVRRR